MSLLIHSYLYHNKIVGYLIDPALFKTWINVMYSRPITLYRGINSTIQIEIRNQDTKPIDSTNFSVKLVIVDPVTHSQISEFDVENLVNGNGHVQVLTENLDARFYKLCLKKINGDGSEDMLYVDTDYGAFLNVEMLDGIKKIKMD